MSSKRQYQKWKSLGLCTSCGEPRDNPNRLICNACAKRHSDYVKDSNRYYQKLHICPVCKTNRLEDGQKRCTACKVMMAERRIKYGYNHEKAMEYERTRRNNLKAQGLCVECGKSKAIEGRTLCENCKKKAKQKRMEKQS